MHITSYHYIPNHIISLKSEISRIVTFDIVCYKIDYTISFKLNKFYRIMHLNLREIYNKMDFPFYFRFFQVYLRG